MNFFSVDGKDAKKYDIVPCFVKLSREKNIDDITKDMPRRLKRVLAQKLARQNELSAPKETSQKPKKQRSKAVEKTPSKPILLKSNRLQKRSKSVTFLANKESSDEEDFIARPNAISRRRNTLTGAPMLDSLIREFESADLMQANEQPPRAHSASNLRSNDPSLVETLTPDATSNPGLSFGVANEVIINLSVSSTSSASNKHTNNIPQSKPLLNDDVEQESALDWNNKQPSESDKCFDRALDAVKNIATAFDNQVVETVGSENMSTDQVRGYENRITDLIESNKSKIMRIKMLLEGRNNFKEQLETMHRLNRSLTTALDMYRAQEGNLEENVDNRVSSLDSQIGELKAEKQVLSERIARINQMNFQMKDEKKILMDEVNNLKRILRTHSSQILGEHNYVL